MALVLQATSRESLATVTGPFEARISGLAAGGRQKLGEELYAVTRVLLEQRRLRRALADPAPAAELRAGLARGVFTGKVGAETLDTIVDLVAVRWSSPADLVESTESLARSALFAAAEKQQALDAVEDELFRFGRILAREPELTTLLGQTDTSADRRVELLDSVLDGKVHPITAVLLAELVRTPRDRHLDLAAEELAELAAARRNRSVAHVRTSAALSAEQEQRLTDSLTRLYGRPIALQIEFDESLLGGLVITVGDEVIDGSVAGRIAAARRALPT